VDGDQVSVNAPPPLETCHWTVGLGEPLTVTLKVAVLPNWGVAGWGCPVMAGGEAAAPLAAARVVAAVTPPATMTVAAMGIVAHRIDRDHLDTRAIVASYPSGSG
jgi:hypothetical protein